MRPHPTVNPSIADVIPDTASTVPVSSATPALTPATVPVPTGSATTATAAPHANTPAVSRRRTHRYTKITLHPGQPSPETVSNLVWNLLLGVQNEVRLLELTDEEGLRGPVTHFGTSLVRHVFIAAVMAFFKEWPHLRLLYGEYNVLPRLGLAVPTGWVSFNSL